MFEFVEKILTTDTRARYDKEALAILSQKRLMAKLLKEVVPEVKNYSIEEIETFIEGQPKIKKVGVHANTKILPRIVGRATESKLLGEGTVKFDLWFNLDIPNIGKPIRIIINVEAQGDASPGYNLPTRSIYYGCRLISEQYETEFFHSDYNNIKKVYSIWVCMPKKRKTNSIESYSIKREQNYGKSGSPDDRYDLMTSIIIRLGTDKVKDRKFLNVLSAIFSDTMNVEEKIEACTENGETISETELLERIKSMSNLGKSIGEEARREGLAEGRAEGITEERQKSIANMVAVLKPYCADVDEVYRQVSGKYPDISFEAVLKLYNQK